MEESRKGKARIQWHPALFAGLQIELENEASNLVFENEHQLGTKPKEIDVWVIKRNRNIPIHKNIGRIFRKHNIIEYKSPEDYLSVDDFYKVCGYACFYKADTKTVNEIPIDEITITFICKAYPRELIKHITAQKRYELKKVEKGIYEIKGGLFKTQIIWTNGLSFAENLWLKSLNTLELSTEQAEYLVTEYGKHKHENLYKSVMNVIVNTNKEQFMEVKNMCEALEELMKDELAEMRARGLSEGRSEGLAIGRVEGRAEGRTEGEKRFGELTRILLEKNQQELLKKAISDERLREKLYEEYQII